MQAEVRQDVCDYCFVERWGNFIGKMQLEKPEWFKESGSVRHDFSDEFHKEWREACEQTGSTVCIILSLYEADASGSEDGISVCEKHLTVFKEKINERTVRQDSEPNPLAL